MVDHGKGVNPTRRQADGGIIPRQRGEGVKDYFYTSYKIVRKISYLIRSGAFGKWIHMKNSFEKKGCGHECHSPRSHPYPILTRDDDKPWECHDIHSGYIPYDILSASAPDPLKTPVLFLLKPV